MCGDGKVEAVVEVELESKADDVFAQGVIPMDRGNTRSVGRPTSSAIGTKGQVG